MRQCAWIAACLFAIVDASAIAGPGDPGPYQAGYQRVTVTRSDTTTFEATVFYPATAAGIDAPLDPSGGPYPAMTFGRGLLSDPEVQYLSTLSHLATRGYIAISSRSLINGQQIPNYALDMSTTLDWLEEAHADANSFLFGVVNVDRFAVGGHSMGAAASTIMAASDPRPRALITLVPFDTADRQAETAAPDLMIPLAMIAASNDTISPPAGPPGRIHAAAPTPKLLAEIVGGWHCGFSDEDLFFCDNEVLPREEQLLLSREMLTSWLDIYLQDDTDAWRYFWAPESPDDVRFTLETSPGAAIEAGGDIVGPAGFELDGSAEITNLVERGVQYEWAAEGNEFPVTFSPPTTLVLDPGEMASVRVVVQVPDDAGGMTDEFLITARSLDDGGTRAFTAVTVIVDGCDADLDGDGDADSEDFFTYLDLFASDDERADLDGDGDRDAEDFFAYLDSFALGCP